MLLPQGQQNRKSIICQILYFSKNAIYSAKLTKFSTRQFGFFAKLRMSVGSCGFCKCAKCSLQNKEMRVGKKLNLFVSTIVSSRSVFSSLAYALPFNRRTALQICEKLSCEELHPRFCKTDVTCWNSCHTVCFCVCSAQSMRNSLSASLVFSNPQKCSCPFLLAL